MANAKRNIILQGQTDEFGGSWLGNGTTTNYTGSIPLEDLEAKLFGWSPVRVQQQNTFVTESGETVIATGDKFDFIRPPFGDWKDARIIGTHSKSYNHLGYRKMIDTVRNILDAEIAVQSAGLLNDGAQAFVQFGLADKQSVLGDDNYVPYITLLDSMNGTHQDQAFTGCVRLKCQNMIAASIKGAVTRYKAKHTKNYAFRIADARVALEILTETSQEFEAEVKAMLDYTVSDSEFEQFVDAIVPLEGKVRTKLAEDKRDALWHLWSKDLRVSTLPPSLYKVEQAVNTYERHFAPQKGVINRTQRVVERMVSGGWADLDLNTITIAQRVFKRPLVLAS